MVGIGAAAAARARRGAGRATRFGLATGFELATRRAELARLAFLRPALFAPDVRARAGAFRALAFAGRLRFAVGFARRLFDRARAPPARFFFAGFFAPVRLCLVAIIRA
jgi:hypothetical protein